MKTVNLTSKKGGYICPKCRNKIEVTPAKRVISTLLKSTPKDHINEPWVLLIQAIGQGRCQLQAHIQKNQEESHNAVVTTRPLGADMQNYIHGFQVSTTSTCIFNDSSAAFITFYRLPGSAVVNQHKQDCLQQSAGADDRVGTIRVQLLGIQQQQASLSAKKVHSSSTSLDEVGHCSRRSSVLRSP
ncbi:hypothetical protein CAPTEDRAFT_211708 [Capitella teleta]|uniref:Uncharacterized protein n=1 Tax=Capitella teleta TaxID=283909 RepID=R7TYP8_CAPTE|nr:hypothetical protein CAPTEDRAFT_211708 [Capitella teleta]|eukprot:ELT96551.1 hypothetical protein CAPTEDRAFT_211708 [Capitella teleta]